MKTSKFQYLFFNCFLIVGAASLSVSNVMMQNYPKNSYIIYLFLLPLILIIPLIAPIGKDSLKNVTSNLFLKILFISYQIISNLIFIFAYLKVTNDYYYNITPSIVIFIIILLTTVFFSTYGVRNIFHIGFVLSCFELLIILVTIFTDVKYDFNLVKNNHLQIDNYLFLLGYLYIYLDVLFLPIFLPYNGISKKDLLIINLIASIICTLLLLQNYLFFDYRFFIATKYPYLSKYLVFTNNLHFEHLDILYLIFISIYFFFRLSLNIEFTRIIMRIRRQSFLIIIFPAILFSCTILTNYIHFNAEIINYLMIVATVISLLFFTILKILIIRRKKWQAP